MGRDSEGGKGKGRGGRMIVRGERGSRCVRMEFSS